MQITRGWIEEGGQIKEAAKRNFSFSVRRWKNNVYGLKKKLLITCDPKKGRLRRDCVEVFFAGTLPANKKFVQASVPNNKPSG